ncbi:MAG: CinA family protein [Chloroflexota bacterium]
MDTTIEHSVGIKLREYGLRLAVAESCTGGLIGHRITNIPGSSTYYMGSITAYAYEAKVRLVNVKWETLENHGAVSDETVAEMAVGVRRSLAADIGISVSGIAGPGGGTPDKPVGLVYFGLSSGKNDLGPFSMGVWTRHHIFKGDRIGVKEQAADYALQFLLDLLEGKLPEPE